MQFVVGRLVEYANILGSESVVDCALGSRLGYAEILGWGQVTGDGRWPPATTKLWK